METSALLILLNAAVSASVSCDHFRTFDIWKTELNWTSAQIHCRNWGKDLVTVHSLDEADELLNRCTKNGSDRIWLGLRHGKNHPKWSNKVTYEHNNWHNESQDNETYCVKMMTDGNWTASNCSTALTFMCYKEGASDPSSKYRLVQTEVPWCEAQRYCRNHYTDLVSITSEDEQKEVMKLDRTKPHWIGLMQAEWEWSDGACTTDKFNIPSNQTGDHVYKLENSWKRTSNITHGQPFCYKDLIYLINKTQTWEKALEYCNTNYNGLLRIESDQEQAIVEAKLRHHNISGHVWLGLRQSRLFGFWIWANGQTVGWSNWEGGGQPEQPLSHICGAIATSGGKKFKWSDQNCLSSSYFLCEGKEDSQ